MNTFINMKLFKFMSDLYNTKLLRGVNAQFCILIFFLRVLFHCVYQHYSHFDVHIIKTLHSSLMFI